MWEEVSSQTLRCSSVGLPMSQMLLAVGAPVEDTLLRCERAVSGDLACPKWKEKEGGQGPACSASVFFLSVLVFTNSQFLQQPQL